jgi:predicted esterase
VGGRGRAFLWSWLRDARSRGAILVAPTSLGSTWSLSGDDVDTPHLAQILEFVSAHWRVDPNQLLLTGMSDGGTFSYVSGLEPASPFTHLAPSCAAFHPMLAQMADAERLRGLPIHITHGALDWMFPVEMARAAHDALSAAGANVSYREVDDLSHVYPAELNGAILDWMLAVGACAGDRKTSPRLTAGPRCARVPCGARRPGRACKLGLSGLRQARPAALRAAAPGRLRSSAAPTDGAGAFDQRRLARWVRAGGTPGRQGRRRGVGSGSG